MRLAGLTFGWLVLAACRLEGPGLAPERPPVAPVADSCTSAPRDVFEQAARHIRVEAEYAHRLVGGAGQNVALEYFLSIAAMQYVQSRVSPYVYAGLPEARREFTSPGEPLLKGAGLCGNQVDTFLRIMRRLGVRERAVQIYAIDAAGNNHIGAEVMVDGKWRFFDVTYATFYRRPGAPSDALLSLAEVLAEARPETLAVTNRSALIWETYRISRTSPLAYATARRPQIFYDGAGVVTVTPTSGYGTAVYRPHQLPNMLGIWSYDVTKAPVETRWVLAGGRRYQRLIVNVNGVACAGGTLHVDGAAGGVAVGPATKQVEIPIGAARARGDLALSVTTPHETCVLVIESVEAFVK